MEKKKPAGRAIKAADILRKGALLLTCAALICLIPVLSGCHPARIEEGEPNLRVAFRVWYVTDEYEEKYETEYYALYQGERPVKTGAFEPVATERYRLKGVDFKGVVKPIEWDKLVDNSGNTIAAEGDMLDILDIMHGIKGDDPYPFDNFEIFPMDGEYYLYTRTYVSKYTMYRYDRKTKRLIELGSEDDVHITQVIGLAGPEA